MKNFELKVKIKQAGNNTGIQYRSKELPEVGKWSIGGYQCDVHPAAPNNAMVYEEKGRGIICQNGQGVVIDPEAKRWLASEHDPLKVDIAEWHEYTVIARGNHLIHKIDGQVTIDLLDFELAKRSLEGLLAFQIHRGPAMKVQIKDVMLKELPEGGVIDFANSPIPSDAQIIEANVVKFDDAIATVISPDEVLSSPTLTLFPSPSDGLVNIGGTPLGARSIHFDNSLGQCVLTSAIAASIDITPLAPGAYIVTVLDGRGIILARSRMVRH